MTTYDINKRTHMVSIHRVNDLGGHNPAPPYAVVFSPNESDCHPTFHVPAGTWIGILSIHCEAAGNIFKCWRHLEPKKAVHWSNEGSFFVDYTIIVTIDNDESIYFSYKTEHTLSIRQSATMLISPLWWTYQVNPVNLYQVYQWWSGVKLRIG